MPRLQYKSFTSPDEVRTFPKGHGVVINLDETTVGRSEWRPGWRWSIDLAPIMGTLKGLSGRRQVFRLVKPDMS